MAGMLFGYTLVVRCQLKLHVGLVNILIFHCLPLLTECCNRCFLVARALPNAEFGVILFAGETWSWLMINHWKMRLVRYWLKLTTLLNRYHFYYFLCGIVVKRTHFKTKARCEKEIHNSSRLVHIVLISKNFLSYLWFSKYLIEVVFSFWKWLVLLLGFPLMILVWLSLYSNTSCILV